MSPKLEKIIKPILSLNSKCLAYLILGIFSFILVFVLFNIGQIILLLLLFLLYKFGVIIKIIDMATDQIEKIRNK